MPSYTITPRTKQMSDLVNYSGDSDVSISSASTVPIDISGVTFTPSLPSIPAGKSAVMRFYASVEAINTSLTRFYIQISIDGFITNAQPVVQRNGSVGVTSQYIECQITNTDSIAHTVEFKGYTTNSGIGTLIFTNVSNPAQILHSYPFTAASDLTLISQVSKIYALARSTTSLSIETKPVNVTWKVVELDIGYLMRGFTWSANASDVVWDYDGFDIGVA